ncbi:MAG TPA: hypothetical protein VF267_03075, partial [Gammaproteobacteria bacterium]
MRATRNILIAACSASGLLAAPAMAESFVMLSKGSHLPANFEVQVKAAGGHITTLLPEIGVAIVESDNPDFKSQGAGISGIQGVATNVTVRMIDPGQLVPLADADFANPPTSGEDDFFFDLQWGHQAIDAAGAWNAGYRGAGVRVAVLDSGIDAKHTAFAEKDKPDRSRVRKTFDFTRIREIVSNDEDDIAPEELEQLANAAGIEPAD